MVLSGGQIVIAVVIRYHYESYTQVGDSNQAYWLLIFQILYGVVWLWTISKFGVVNNVEATPVIIYTYLSITIAIYLRYVAYKNFWYDTLEEKSLSFIISNIWVFNIVLNFRFMTRYSICPIGLIVFSMMLKEYCTWEIFSLQYWNSKSFYKCMLVLYILEVFFLYMQWTYGSYFLLPKNYRYIAFDRLFMKRLNWADPAYKSLMCHVWMNPLHLSELWDADEFPEFSWRQVDKSQYIKILCGHTFHPNCFYNHIRENKCPVCLKNLP